jgi:hypothetical protein
MTEKDIARMIRRAADEVGGVAQLARAWQVSRVYLYDVMKADRRPGPSILSRLGIEVTRVPAVTVYRMKSGREKSSVTP